jgi:REP element-mobilizing transposase RayT
MVQGLNKEYIFNSETDKYKYKKLIKENLSLMQDNAPTILSYCLMDNHTHFIFHTLNFSNLSKFMHQINMHYSTYYNKHYNRVGYVFRDRFKVQEINSREQLFNCLRYVHNNPVKASICKSMSDYKFSSYNEFLGHKEIITNESIELLFGTTDNFNSLFEMIHQTYNSENFLDIHDLSLEDFTNKFIKENNVSFSELSESVILLKKYIKSAKTETDCTFLDISKYLGIAHSTVGYYYRN